MIECPSFPNKNKTEFFPLQRIEATSAAAATAATRCVIDIGISPFSSHSKRKFALVSAEQKQAVTSHRIKSAVCLKIDEELLSFVSSWPFLLFLSLLMEAFKRLKLLLEEARRSKENKR